MQRIMKTLSRQRTSLFAAILVTALSLLLVLPVQAEPQPVALKDGLDQSQIYNGDLEVTSHPGRAARDRGAGSDRTPAAQGTARVL